MACLMDVRTLHYSSKGVEITFICQDMFLFFFFPYVRIFRRTNFRLGTRLMTVAAWQLTYNMGFIGELLP